MHRIYAYANIWIVDVNLSVNPQLKPRIHVVDNFYESPMDVRNFALQQEFMTDIRYFKGARTAQQFDFPGLRETFEQIVGFPITRWAETHGVSTRFQFCTAVDQVVYHCDQQSWAGVLFLTPDAPYSSGTSFFAHRETGARNMEEFQGRSVFENIGYYDRSKFELVDVVGNVFNRLVLFNSHAIHAADQYFGTTKENGRLFQVFFFN